MHAPLTVFLFVLLSDVNMLAHFKIATFPLQTGRVSVK
jgi:hypothetical protein